MNKRVLVTRSSMPPYEEYIEKIKPLWESCWLTNMGAFHNEFENALKDYLDVQQVSLMTNGHMALEMTLQAMNFQEGGEVITTPFTFVSTTHAISRNRLRPVFCDIKETDYTIDETKIEALITDKTVAILPVHVYGNLCNVDAIQDIAMRHGLKVIYDAAHAFGEHYRGIGVGNFGDASVFSFHATKVFNSIEGGAVTFSDPELYNRLYNLKNFGIRGEEQIAEIGANAKMNEFAAAMGLCNLPYVSENIKLRKQVVGLYTSLLSGTLNLRLLSYDDSEKDANFGYYPVLFSSSELRNRVYETLKSQNIYARKYFYPLTVDADCYREQYREVMLPVARSVANRILVMPLYPELTQEDVERICDCVIRCCETLN